MLAQHRFLRSTHIASLTSRSLDRVNDRLLRLFHGGYVDRIPDWSNGLAVGSAPVVYSLAARGRATIGLKYSRAASLGRGGRTNVMHELEIADFVAALRLDAQRRALSIAMGDELLPTYQTNTIGAQLFAFRGHRGDAVVPDLAFAVHFADGSRRCFLGEIDRGTMPIRRSSARASSICKKFEIYMAGFLGRRHEVSFGWKTFRVAIVTTSAERLRAMQSALREYIPLYGSGTLLFLIADRSQVLQNALGPIWQDVKGDQHSLS
jgi:hypothetical protein